MLTTLRDIYDAVWALRYHAPLLIPVALVGVVWTRLGWRAGLLALLVAIAAAATTLAAHAGESKRLRAWYADEIGRADDELDILDALRPRYDALVDLTAAIVATRSGTKEERAALRALRNATPPTETEEASAAA